MIGSSLVQKAPDFSWRTHCTCVWELFMYVSSRCAGVTAGLPFFCSRCVRTGQRVEHISTYSGCLRGIKHREKGFWKSDCKWIIPVNTLPCSRQYLHKSASLPWIKWSSDSSFCHYLWQDAAVIPVRTAVSVDIFCKENQDWASGQRSAKFITVKKGTGILNTLAHGKERKRNGKNRSFLLIEKQEIGYVKCYVD